MKHVIYYYPSLGNDSYEREFNENPLAIEEVGYSPKPLLKWRNEIQTFTECPAYREWGRKTWVVEFPTDLEIHVDIPRKHVGISNTHWQPYLAMQGENLWEQTQKPVFQFTSGFLFWTKSKNLWMQVTGPQETVFRNNFRTIEGQYPISVWTRSTNLAFQMEDVSRPVVLKRGDPVLYISFFSGRIKDGFVLEMKKPDPEVLQTKSRAEFLKNLVPGLAWKIIAGRNEREVRESKCPFARLGGFLKR